MQSKNKLMKIAKNIVKKDKYLFDTLVEFENTKKLRTKTRLNFTIDKNIASQFKKFCRDKGYNMSAKMEQAIKDILNKDR